MVFNIIYNKKKIIIYAPLNIFNDFFYNILIFLNIDNLELICDIFLSTFTNKAFFELMLVV